MNDRTQAAALAAQWRGVAAEDADQITAPVSALLRGRSHRLLRSLLRPHKRAARAFRRHPTMTSIP